MKKPKVIHIHGRLWFDKVNGNTYHSAMIWVDGEAVQGVPFQYGYGSQYEWNAMQKLKELGYLPGIAVSAEPLWSYCNRNGIKVVSYADHFPRKKDL